MIFDSNIVIYAAKTEGAFLRPLLRETSASVASVTPIEVLGFPGWTLMDPMQRALLETLVGGLPELPLTRRVSDRAIELRRQKSMKLGDAIIAATALVHDMPLVTRNTDDFRHVASLEIVNPFAAA